MQFSRRVATTIAYSAITSCVAACDSAKVANTDASVAVVEVSPPSVTIGLGVTAQFTATARSSTGTVVTDQLVSWESSKPAVATVSTSGLVTAASLGDATITATVSGKSGTAAVTVTPPQLDHVIVAPATTSITVGGVQPFAATAYDVSNRLLAESQVSWTSSNPSVATIDPNGVAVAIAAGTTTISATAQATVGGGTTTGSKTGTAQLVVTAQAASCTLVTDLTRRPTSAFATPSYRQGAVEPDFGTTIIRLTGDPGTAIGNGVSGSWPTVAYHQYAKVEPWSADGKLIVLSAMSGAGPTPGAQLFLDGETYQPLFWRAHPGSEARWHPTLPDIQIYVATDGSVGHWNARTNVSTPKVRVAGYANATMGDYEGNPSYDGRYVVVTATRVSDGKPVAFAVDIDGGTKYPDIDLLANGVSDMDWASISPLGTYVHVLGVIDGRGQTSKIFTKQGTLMSSWPDNPLGHSDLGIDGSGNEVIFGAASNGVYSKRFLTRRLDNGQVTPLTAPISFDWHVSTRANRRAGWGLVSTNDATGSVFDREIYWVRLDGSGRVERLAHHRTNQTDSQTDPIPVPTPDGKRVLFASNWGSSTGRPVQTFVIDTRTVCP